MKKINSRLLTHPLFALLAEALGDPAIGKVRHTYPLPGFPNLLLVVATDRISIFDFILNALVRFKGAVLTAMTVHWMGDVFPDLPNHLVAFGNDIDDYLPKELHDNVDLQSRAIVVKKLKMLPVELIIRGNLMGSGTKSYLKDGTVCGIKLPEGLVAGSELPEPIFTPSTKSETDHDENISFEQMVIVLAEWLKKIRRDEDPQIFAGKVYDLAMEVYKRARKNAREHFVEVLDTKFEFGINESGVLVIGDEVLTPDSSRFTRKAAYDEALAAGKEPKTSDKQYVRNIGAKIETPFTRDTDGSQIVGINNLSPQIEAHVDFVSDLSWDDAVLDRTTALYLMIFADLVGKTLFDFETERMYIVG